MPDYSAYILNAGGHVVNRHDLQADDDAQAVQIASQYVNGHDVEVRQRDRVVGLLFFPLVVDDRSARKRA